MSSANYAKYKTVQKAKAMMYHNSKDTRLDAEHQNPDINKELTQFNISETYADMCALYDARINELDSTTNENKRKDRITLMSLVIPVPKNLPREKYAEWFADVNETIIAHYGKENVLPMAVHYDEEHEYMDPDTSEMVMSRVHGHFMVIPEHDGGLNAHWANSRKNICTMNEEIHDITLKKYDVEFMDGTKRKGKNSVEELKNASKKAEQEIEIKLLTEKTNKLRGDLPVLHQMNDEGVSKLVEISRDVEERSVRLLTLDARIKDKITALKELDAFKAPLVVIEPVEPRQVDWLKKHNLNDPNGNPVSIYDVMMRQLQKQGSDMSQEQLAERTRKRNADIDAKFGHLTNSPEETEREL